MRSERRRKLQYFGLAAFHHRRATVGLSDLPAAMVTEEHRMTKSTRNVLRWLVLLTCLVMPGWAVAASPKAGPQMAIEEPSFDFNEVKEGTTLEHTFRVVNRGGAVLRIKRIKPS